TEAQNSNIPNHTYPPSQTNTHTTIHIYSITPQPPKSTLFPYTTLFRSMKNEVCQLAHQLGVGHALRALGEKRGRELHDLFKACRSEEHTSELQSRSDLVCRLLLEKKKMER